MYLTSNERLGRHDLAALLKVLVDLEYKHPTNSYERLFENAHDLQRIFVTDEQKEQVKAAVAAVPPDALRRAGQPSLDGATDAYTITTAGRARVPLGEMLYHAWVQVHGSADDERIVVLAEEPDGLLVPDPRDKDLDGLGIAEVFFLVAHDRHDGRPRLAPMVLACGTAAALLAELLLHNLLTIDLVCQVVCGVVAVLPVEVERLPDPFETIARWQAEQRRLGYRFALRDVLEKAAARTRRLAVEEARRAKCTENTGDGV